MYDSPRRRAGNRVAGAHARQYPAGHHEASYRTYLRRHERDAAAAARGTRGERRRFAAKLLARAADTRNLMCAIHELTREGVKAPGPNGVRLATLDKHERWSLARTLEGLMTSGTYRAGPTRTIHVPKSSGNGTRPIELHDAEDTVVQRAIMQVVEPLLTRGQSPNSFGYRRGLGREHALAAAAIYARQANAWTVITEDLKDAFTRIPVNRLLDILRRHDVPTDITDLIYRAIGDRRRGIPQGAPISPTLLNVYLDHVLDRPWTRNHPGSPLIRVADDLLVLTPSPAQATPAYSDLTELVRPTGMQLKGTREDAVKDLAAGQHADWLGFRILRERGTLAAQIGVRAWDRLAQNLALCHEGPLAPIRAIETVHGWIDQMGPCRETEDVQEIYARISDLMSDQHFDEVPPLQELAATWDRSLMRYAMLRLVGQMGADHGIGILAAGSAHQHHFAVHPDRSSTAVGSVPAAQWPPANGTETTIVVSSDASSSGAGGWGHLVVTAPGHRLCWRAGTHPRTDATCMALTGVTTALATIDAPVRVNLIIDDPLARRIVDRIVRGFDRGQVPPGVVVVGLIRRVRRAVRHLGRSNFHVL